MDHEATSDVFAIFCNYQKILEYLSEFHYLLQNSISSIDCREMTKFYKLLQFLEQNSCLDKNEDDSNNRDFSSILLKIFDIISIKYFSNNLACDEAKKLADIPHLFDSVALMVKIFLTKFNVEISVKCLLDYITKRFKDFSESYSIYSDDSSSEKEQLQNILKLFVSVLRYLKYTSSNHISCEILTSILNSFPFSNKYAVNIFNNCIIPSLFTVSDLTLKKLKLELIWQKIVANFKGDSHAFNESYYSLLCCFVEYVFKEDCKIESFDIFDNTLWEIIQHGLRSDNCYSRKQVVYVFQTALFSLKSKNCVSSVPYKNVPLFSLSSTKDLLIWNDLVTLFETLEEKQSHVIKPVLPKFSRILQQTSKVPNSKVFFSIHPSWVTCFLRRMIFHESKFVVKHALSVAMNIDFKDCQVSSEEFIEVILAGFNDQNMYCRMNENDSSSLFLSSEKIALFLSNYISAFENEFEKVSCLRYLLKLIASQTWCGVALLHLTFALTSLNPLPSWKKDDFVHIRNIIQNCFKTHESMIRIAIEHWLMKACILFIDWTSLCFEDIANLLCLFKTLEHRETFIWNAVSTKVKEILSSGCSDNLTIHKAEEFSFNCVNKILATPTDGKRLDETDLQKMAKLLFMFADSSVISTENNVKNLNWFRLLQPLTSVLKNAPKRPYMSQEKFLNVLQFYIALVDAAQGSNKYANDAHCSAITKCFDSSVELVEYIYEKSLMSITTDSDIFQFEILFNALHVLSSLKTFTKVFYNLLQSFLLNYDSIPYVLSKKIIIVLFYEISVSRISDIECSDKFSSSSLKVLIDTYLSKIICEDVIDDLSKSIFVNEISKEVWLKLAVKSVCKFWQCTCSVVPFLSSTEDKDLVSAVVHCTQYIFDGGAKETYAYAINCLEVLIPKLGIKNIHVIENMLNAAYKACLELHGCDAFRSAINSFIKAVFQPFMLNQKGFHILYKYIDCFQSLSENALGIFYLVIKRFCDTFPLKDLYKINFNYIPFLIYSLTYGPVHHKCQKILEDTVLYISEQDEHFLQEFKNYNKPSIFVRVNAIIYLLKNLHERSMENEKISLELLNALFKLDDGTRTSKSSKFSNSYNHRVRNRVWQVILLLQPNLITEEESKRLLINVIGLLELENQQPSIRYLQEWVLLKILYDYQCFIDDFIHVLENSLEKRPGFQVSLISILIHLIIHGLLLSERQIEKCFPILIQFCMAQNFAVRLYSRLAISKLLSSCKVNNFSKIIQKYDFFCKILCTQQSESILTEKGNVYKNLLKLTEDFYFSVFHPVEHFNLETIFFEMPRLSNMAPEELVKAEYFKYQLDSVNDCFNIPCFNTDDSLKNSSVTSWSDKSADESPVLENSSFDYNFQKKISPVKCEIYDCVTDLFFENKPKQNGMIVVASLIDKIPNLGGLCRTCEVFGVDQFVIGSLKYADDKMFQNLAVSSDRWVSIKEVKPYHLKQYLMSLKDEGYTLVGAEQTDDSHKLSNYTFPQKTALVLGHEKQGMPVDLIQVLDVCVEIPQQGIIRSLNVHVSGAIFIWEYARQQIKHP